MRLKAVKSALTAAAVIVTGLLAVIFFARPGGEAVKRPPTGDRPPTLNAVIGEAVTVYASAPYRRYSRNELEKYFSGEITESILADYEPFTEPGEETPIVFEEQLLPEIRAAEIKRGDGVYTVKLAFGEVFYNYVLTVTPNRIITEITDGGITFE